MLFSGVGEELNESNPGAESTKKSVVVESPLSDDDASQKAADLKNEVADDLTLSCHEKNLQQVMLLEGENVQDDRKGGEEECLESQNESDDRKNNEECSGAEEVPCDNSESDHCNDLPIHDLQKKGNQEENKPVPKPRVHKMRNASASGEKKAFECCCCYLLSIIIIFSNVVIWVVFCLKYQLLWIAGNLFNILLKIHVLITSSCQGVN